MNKEDIPKELRDYVKEVNAIKVTSTPEESFFIKGFMERICNINESVNVYKIKNIINEMRVLNVLDYNEYMYLQNVCDSTIKYLVTVTKK